MVVQWDVCLVAMRVVSTVVMMGVWSVGMRVAMKDDRKADH